MTRVHCLTTMGMCGLFLLGCGDSLAPPGKGAIEVTSVTTGSPADADGYRLTIDGGDDRVLGPNSSLRILDLLSGNHVLTLGDIASNCSLTGPNPRNASVTDGNTTQIAFQLGCSANTGTIEITTATTGESVDTDGYLATLDGDPGRPIDSDGTITFTTVSSGSHTVRLTAIAANCTAGENPRTVVVAGEAVEVHFDVVCGPPTGSILISTATGGIRPDADGYEVSVDGGAAQEIGPNASLAVPGLPLGEHTVQLSGVASNCAVGGQNPRTVTVTNGGSAPAAFQVGCTLVGNGRLLFARNQSNTAHLYSMRQDGSDIVDLTPSMTVYDGDWSPDGSRIAFARYVNGAPSIYLMNADGSDVVGLGIDGDTPKWSPDGSRIVFELGGVIRVVESNGSQATTLTFGRRPDWSPDGTRILFDKVNQQNCPIFDICIMDLYIMASDASDVRLLEANAMCGAWSPDGSRIAFVSFLSGLSVMNADGTGVRPIVETGFSGGSVGCPVVWSPDGAAIAYAAGQSDGTSEVTVIPSSGGPGAVLAGGPGSEFPESWK